MELLCGSSDEDFELPSTITTEQHGPHLRPSAFAAIPRHIVGCSIGYHQGNRQCARLLPWPLQRHGRGEPEALLRCIRALGGAQPKDKLWKDQLTSLRRYWLKPPLYSNLHGYFSAETGPMVLFWLPPKSLNAWKLLAACNFAKEKMKRHCGEEIRENISVRWAVNNPPYLLYVGDYTTAVTFGL